VEHDALEILRRTYEVIGEGLEKRGLQASDLAAIGITNQRETTVVWDRRTGEPLANALVWQDTRVRRTSRTSHVREDRIGSGSGRDFR